MKIGCLHIEGFKGKRNNREILELIEDWDIVGFVETWLDESSKKGGMDMKYLKRVEEELIERGDVREV